MKIIDVAKGYKSPKNWESVSPEFILYIKENLSEQDVTISLSNIDGNNHNKKNIINFLFKTLDKVAIRLKNKQFNGNLIIDLSSIRKDDLEFINTLIREEIVKYKNRDVYQLFNYDNVLSFISSKQENLKPFTQTSSASKEEEFKSRLVELIQSYDYVLTQTSTNGELSKSFDVFGIKINL